MIQFTLGYFGWLGNQMFQYAATFASSKRLGVECGFPENTPNLYDIFNISSTKVTSSQKHLYMEPSFQYSPIPDIDNLTLYGYFQSEKYFSDYADAIRKEFTFKDDCADVASGTVSLHVRRGDYLDLQDHHPLCNLEYYNNAMAMFPGARFLVFSDDIEWCKQNIKGDAIEYSEGNSASTDLQLMTKCDHHIIANSSYSWWGAWLGKNKDKTVVAPKAWFGPAKRLITDDIYAKGWIVK